MKRASVRLLSVSLLLLTLCAGPTLSPALAPEPPGGGGSGTPHWQITITRSGSTTVTVRNANGVEVYPSGTYNWNNPPDPPQEPSLLWMNVGDTITIDSHGTYTVSAVWLDEQGHPAIPPDVKKKLHLLVTLHAGWSVTVNYGDRDQYDVLSQSAADGWPDEEIVAEVINFPWTAIKNGASDGKHLITLDGSSGTATYTRQQNAYISVWSTGASGTVSAGCSLDAAENSRYITLSRDGARGETVDPDGTVHGDTTYSYYSWIGDDPPIRYENINWQIFHPVFCGTWTWKYDPQIPGDIPDVTWTWTPDCTQNTWDTGHWSMLFGQMYRSDAEWQGGPGSPIVRTMTYTAEDNGDHAIATANYILTIHEPYEKNYPDNVTPHHVTNVRPHPYAEWNMVSPDAPGPMPLTLQVSSSYGWNVTINFGISVPISKWFAFTLNFSPTFTRSYTVSNGTTIPDVPPGYGTYLEIYDVVNVHDSFVDTWDEGGYVAKEPTHWEVPDEPCGGSRARMPLTRMN
jgi:hypothetical protein